MIALRAVVALLARVLLLIIAAAGLIVAVGSVIPEWTTTQVRLPGFRDTVGGWLQTLEAPGPAAVVALLSGVGAVLLGLLLLVGTLRRGRERMASLDKVSDGSISARRRVLASVAVATAEDVGGVLDASARVRPPRRMRGRMRVHALAPPPAERKSVDSELRECLDALAKPFRLKLRLRTRDGGRRG